MDQTFFECHPLFKNYQEAISISAYDSLPLVLTEALNGLQVSSYGNGFFAFVNNNTFADVFQYWNLPREKCFIFMKSAFGMFLFHYNKYFHLLDPINNEVVELIGEDDFGFLINTLLCDQGVLTNTFMLDVFKETVGSIHPPELDECFAFVPALRLGGSLSALNIEKVKLREHLLLLSQL